MLPDIATGDVPDALAPAPPDTPVPVAPVPAPNVPLDPVPPPLAAPEVEPKSLPVETLVDEGAQATNESVVETKAAKQARVMW